MKKFTVYLKESEQPIETGLKADLMDMIEKSLNTSDNKTVDGFIEAYKKDSEKNQIDGLINNSDVYDFYLKYMDEIDEVLSNSDFYEKSPNELGEFSLYGYVILGTKKAVNYIINGFSKQNDTDF